jgi:hypothetical protein
MEGADEVVAAINDHADSVKRSVGFMPVDMKKRPEDRTVITEEEEEEEIGGCKILICLVQPAM